MVKINDTGEVNWIQCPARGCHNNFDLDPTQFVVSGDGDWKHTITCLKCFHIRHRVPNDILAELLAEQWGLRKSQILLVLG